MAIAEPREPAAAASSAASVAPAPTAPATTAEQPLPPSQKWFWAAGGLAENFIQNSIGTLSMPIYNIGLGVSPTVIGIITSIPRFLDAIIDPIIGNVSDNANTRWGRRRPFILAGGLMTGLCFALTWMPPSFLTAKGLTLYFLVTSVLCFFFYGVMVIPFNALGLELSNDYHERTRVQRAKYLFMVVAQLAMNWLYWLCLKVGELVKGGGEGPLPEVIGVRYVGVVVGLIVFGSAMLPALLCRERVRVDSHHEKIRLIEAMRLTASHRTFRILAALFICVTLGLNVVGPVGNYVAIYHACGGDKLAASKWMGIGGTLQGFLMMFTAFPVTWVASHWSKKKAMMIGQVVTIFGSLSSWIFYNPAHPAWQIIPWSIMCVGLTCVFILTPSMLADVCDVDELEIGMKRAGMFTAVFALIQKLGVGFSILVSGYVLALVGFSEKLPVQAPTTIFWMRLLFAVVPACLVLASFFFTWRFPITEQFIRGIRAKIEARDLARAAAGPQA